MKLVRSLWLGLLCISTQKSTAQPEVPKYFQQEVHYAFDVYLDDQSHTLAAAQSITYINHSPDTLREMYVHLWANAYSSVQSAFAKQQLQLGYQDFFFARPEDRGGFDSIEFLIGGQRVWWHYVVPHIDVALLHLPKPLWPGDTLELESKWLLRIPKVFSRLGREGQSYYMTQWYPKPAVYDREGWHPMPYLDVGEFYSEMGNFDLRLNLPRNYVVAATGQLHTAEELHFLQQRLAETQHLIQYADAALSDEIPPSDSVRKTLHFTAEQVHDFAWFADKRFLVVKDSAVLSSGKKVDTWAFFQPTALPHWQQVARWVGCALQYYDQHVGPYPWPQATAVSGPLEAGDGMEYPMITLIASDIEDVAVLENIVVHMK